MNNSELLVVDIEFGLKQLSGSKELLFKMYEKFYSDFQQTNREIAENINANDMEAARVLAHTIKGVSGNLGFRLLHQTSADFEGGLKEDEVLSDAHQAFEVALERTLAELNSLLNEDQTETTQSAPTSSEHNNSELLSRMQSAVNNSEFIDDQDIKEFVAAFTGKAQQTDIDDFASAIENFDFESAKRALSNITTSL